MSSNGSLTIGREVTLALLAVCAAVLASGIVPIGTPVFVVTLVVAGENWRRSSPSSRGPLVLFAAAGVLAVLAMAVVVFALAV